jgi:hypothetical protein
MDLLLEHVDPSMLLAEDVRGNTPFAYARREHDAKWIEFLEQRRGKLRQQHDAFASSRDAVVECGSTHATPADSAMAASRESGADVVQKESTNETAS